MTSPETRFFSPDFFSTFLNTSTGHGLDQLATALESKGGLVENPIQKGAIGNGIADDTAYLIAANAAYGRIVLNPGKIFRCSSDITIGVIYAAGGIISIDAGVTLTYSSVEGDWNTICFSGNGTARATSRSYSIGHYAGSSLDAKWNMCRRAFIAYDTKEVHFHRPPASDPAASGPGVWKLNAPIIIDDPENVIKLFQYGPWYANTPMTQMIEYSPVAKTENINWAIGLELDGGNHATHGELIHGGARIHHYGYTAFNRFLGDDIHCFTDLWPMDELYYQWVNCTGFGGIGLNISGGAGGPVLGGSVDNLFFNGASAGATNVYKLSGNVRGFRILNLLENTYAPSGLFEPSESFGLVENTATSAPLDCTIGDTFLNVTTKPALIARDTTSGAGGKIGLNIGKQFAVNGATIPLQLAWCDRLIIEPQRQDGTLGTIVSFGSGVVNVDVQGVEDFRIGGRQASKLRIEGSYVFRQPLADDALAVLTTSASPFGVISVVCSRGSDAVAQLFANGPETLIAIYAGTDINLTTGVLAPGEGVDGKLNLSLVAGTLYISNRLGSTYTMSIIATTA